MRLGGWSIAALILLAVLGVACDSGAPKGNYTPVSTGAKPSSTPPTSSVPTSTAPTSVPVDQIPPGRPARWVPAGVPTTAKYKEPGDVVPMFTLAMFEDSQAGALDAAKYYADAQNWSTAIMSGEPYGIICDSDQCRSNVAAVAKVAKLGQHVVGQRNRTTSTSVLRAPAASKADWVVQLHLSITAGKLVSASGAVVQAAPASTEIINIYLRWSGTMWRVSQEALAS